MEKRYIIGIDQSTQGTKALLFDGEGHLLRRTDLPHRQIVNEKGWVSHDLNEIYRNTVQTVKTLVAESGVAPETIAGIGISNQRETTAIWDKATGEPLEEAIVWQCGRASGIAQEIAEQGHAEEIREATGLQLSAYFPAAKMAWLLRNGGEERQKRAADGKLCLGTIDSWLVYKLTGDHAFKTDFSNASRTQLFNLKTLAWDEKICEMFGIPVCALALLFIGWVVSRWLQKSLFPRLLKRSWHFAFTHPLLESFARPAARIAWYTGMYLALRSLPWAIPGLAALLLKAYRMMLVFLIGTGFYHASGIAALLLASSSEEVRTNRTLLTLLDKVYKVAVVVLCGATIAQESGLPVGSVVASAGLIGLTISLAAQDMAKNFFSGVVILLDKPFSIGDWITVGDVEGEVVDINFRSTKVRAVDNSIYILTNSTVSSATINNATLRNKRLYRFTLGVTYDTTRPQLEKLMADLDAMLKASPDTYEDTAFVRMTGFGDSSINLMVSAYLRTADLGVFLRMQNDLNLNIMDVMKADGVDFAFPSTTVYLAKEN